MGFQSPEVRDIQKSVTDMVLGEVKRTFNPEFINRIDEIIVFDPLTDDDLRQITRMLIGVLNQHLADRQLQIEVLPEVIDWIIEATCRDRSYGARPLRRAIQRYIEDPLSEELIRGELRTGVIELYLDQGVIAWRAAGQGESGRRLAVTV
jgi:ATP-dependent Clp protease ATP-binding subunit ClpC